VDDIRNDNQSPVQVWIPGKLASHEVQINLSVTREKTYVKELPLFPICFMAAGVVQIFPAVMATWRHAGKSVAACAKKQDWLAPSIPR